MPYAFLPLHRRQRRAVGPAHAYPPGIWRGKQQLQLSNGKWHEVAVYRLDDGHWDCYHENELHSALRWGDDAYRSPFQATPYS